MSPNEISVSHLRSQQRDVFDELLRGESFIVKRAGKSIAALINIDDYREFSLWQREKARNPESSFAGEATKQYA